MTTKSAAASFDTKADGLFARAQAGDQDAWRELFEECYDKVVRVVRRKLDRQHNPAIMRSIYDSSDIANDVWKSLAAKSDRFEFPSVNELMAFLAHAAEQRVIDEYRRLNAQKRAEGQKRSLYNPAIEQDYEFPSHDPSPSQIALANEADEYLDAVVEGDTRTLLVRKRMGDSNEEAATYLNWTVRKVQRVLKSLASNYDNRSRCAGIN